MIRPANPADVPAILEVWLEASARAHGFIPYCYWRDHVPAMRDVYLPQSETHVLDVDGRVQGFVSLVENDLAALFVAPGFQGRGSGRALLAVAMAGRADLSLWVYRDNRQAVNFYHATGFICIGERVDTGTGCAEQRMAWRL